MSVREVATCHSLLASSPFVFCFFIGVFRNGGGWLWFSVYPSADIWRCTNAQQLRHGEEHFFHPLSCSFSICCYVGVYICEFLFDLSFHSYTLTADSQIEQVNNRNSLSCHTLYCDGKAITNGFPPSRWFPLYKYHTSSFIKLAPSFPMICWNVCHLALLASIRHDQSIPKENNPTASISKARRIEDRAQDECTKKPNTP